MSSALDAIIERAECMVADGGRDAEAIIRECYDLEVYDWFTWELLKAVFSADELVQRAGADEELIEYCIGELSEEVQRMVDDAEQEDEDREEAVDVWYDLELDASDLVGNREQDVFDHVAKVENIKDNGHDLWKFFHEDGEHSCTWDATTGKFIN